MRFGHGARISSRSRDMLNAPKTPDCPSFEAVDDALRRCGGGHRMPPEATGASAGWFAGWATGASRRGSPTRCLLPGQTPTSPSRPGRCSVRWRPAPALCLKAADMTFQPLLPADSGHWLKGSTGWPSGARASTTGCSWRPYRRCGSRAGRRQRRRRCSVTSANWPRLSAGDDQTESEERRLMPNSLNTSGLACN